MSNYRSGPQKRSYNDSKPREYNNTRSYDSSKPSDDIKCWKCNEQGHTSKNCPKIIELNKNTTCFGCRRKGHNYASCPYNEAMGSVTCYTCGENGHASRNCPKSPKDKKTPDYSFAECFICKQRGHISSQCPENKNKVFPKGGSCFRCGSTEHLARNCALPRTDDDGESEKKKGDGAVFNFDDDTAPVAPVVESSKKKKQKSDKTVDGQAFSKIAKGDKEDEKVVKKAKVVSF